MGYNGLLGNVSRYKKLKETGANAERWVLPLTSKHNNIKVHQSENEEPMRELDLERTNRGAESDVPVKFRLLTANNLYTAQNQDDGHQHG